MALKSSPKPLRDHCGIRPGLPLPAGYAASTEIAQRAKDPNQWPAPGRDNQLTRHSDLKDIKTENVNKLEMIWAQSTGALRGTEGQPIVISDVGGKSMLFMVSGCDQQ